MGDIQQGGARPDDLADALQALLLEVGVAHGQDLVDQQDVGLEIGGDGEAEAHLHADGEELDLAVDGVGQLGELDDLVELLSGCRSRPMPRTAP